MSLQFYLGAAGSGKSFKLHKDINEWAQREPETNFLFIVPDQYTMQTQVDLVNASPAKGIMNIDVLSFSRLAHRVFEELGADRRKVLDDTGKSLVLRHLADGLSEELPVIGRNLNKIGYIHEIKSVISEFKQYDISPLKLDELIAFSKNKGMLNSKLKDIKKLYEVFNDYICNDYITSEETMTLLTEKIVNSKIVSGSVIILDGFTGFTPVQYRLIQCLLGLTKRVIVSVTIDIDSKPYTIEGEQELFYLSKKTIKNLQKLAQEINVPFEKDILLSDTYRFKNNCELSHLEKNIFRYPITVFDEENRFIELNESANPGDEVNDCFLKIKELVMKEGWAYRDIAVICADFESYADEFVRASNIYDIPIFLDENKKIKLNPFVEYIKSALNIVRDGFSYDSVMHFLRSGLTDISNEEIDLLDNYLLKCNVRGRRKWEMAFSKAPIDISDEEWKSEEKSDKAKEALELLGSLNESREKVIYLLQPLIKSKDTVRDRILSLYEFIIRGDIEKRLLRYSDSFADEGNDDKAMEYKQIYPMIMDLLDQIYTLLGEETISLAEFINILESGIEELDVGTIPKGIDKVLIGDLERSRVPEKRMLMLIGINDGNVPRNSSKGGIISDIDREFLKESNIELSPTPREQIFIQKLYLYLNMTKTRERLYVSYCRLSADGKTKRESYLISTIRKMFPKVKETKIVDHISFFEKIYGPKDGRMLLSRALPEYVNGQLEMVSFEQLAALLSVLMDEDREKLISRIIDAAFFTYNGKKISDETAKQLYGKVLTNSISRLEKFSGCQYAHFLQYGLYLTEREEGDFDNRDLGNIYHEVLRKFSEKLQKEGKTLLNYEDEMLENPLKEIVENEAVTYGSSVLHKSAKNSHIAEKIYDITAFSLKTIKKQLQEGAFIPKYFEHKFREKIEISEDEEINIKGIIDRVDVCEDEGNTYVKIVDYKSSDKNIEFDKIFYGLSFQHPVYMMHMLDELSAGKSDDERAKMAAMLYYTIQTPLVDGEDDAEETDLEQALLKGMRPNGYVTDDKNIVRKLDREILDIGGSSFVIPVRTTKGGEFYAGTGVLSEVEYKAVEEYVKHNISEIGKEILGGNININPYQHDKEDACKYCSFKDVCGFDTKIDGYSKRILPKMKKDDAINRMREELTNDTL